jgi:hypothetical protein
MSVSVSTADTVIAAAHIYAAPRHSPPAAVRDTDIRVWRSSVANAAPYLWLPGRGAAQEHARTGALHLPVTAQDNHHQAAGTVRLNFSAPVWLHHRPAASISGNDDPFSPSSSTAMSLTPPPPPLFSTVLWVCRPLARHHSTIGSKRRPRLNSTEGCVPHPARLHRHSDQFLTACA